MIKSLILLFVWYPLRWILYFLPSGIVYAGCDSVGNILSLFYKERKEIMKAELKALIKELPETEYERIANTAFKHIIMDEVERLYFDKRNKVLSILDFKGLKHLDGALKNGKGAVMVLAHFGNHLLVIPVLGYKGYPIYQLAEQGASSGEKKPGFLQSLVIKRRRSLGAKMPAEIISANKVGKNVFKILEDNKVLLCAFDGRVGERMKEFDFIGRNMLLSSGIFKIAQLNDSPVLPLFIVREKDSRHILTIGAPLKYETPDEGVKEFLEVFRDFFVRHPEQYAANLMLERLRSDRGGTNPLFSDHG